MGMTKLQQFSRNTFDVSSFSRLQISLYSITDMFNVKMSSFYYVSPYFYMFYFMYYHICVCHVSRNITYLLTYLPTYLFTMTVIGSRITSFRLVLK